MIVHPKAVSAACLIAAIFTFVSTAHAVVETFDGTVTGTIQEFQGTTPGNSEFAFKDLDQTTPTLPLITAANLSHSENEKVVAAATAQTQFSDPTEHVLPDPSEFGINLAAYSVSATTSYSAQSEANEIRSITFLDTEIGSPDGTAIQVQSQFFLDGVILLWGEANNTNLAGVTADITVTVAQTRPASPAVLTVLDAGLTFTGQADGTATLSTNGQLVADNLQIVNLSNTVPGFGPLQMIILPTVAIPYTYSAQVGETFELKATIQSNIRNQPNTGASVTLGVPLLELAALINTVSGGTAGDLLLQALQFALVNTPPPLKPLLPKENPTTVTLANQRTIFAPLCGSVGIESALLLTLFSTWALMSSRRK